MFKRLFEKEEFDNDITLEVKHRSSYNNGVSVKPKELKGGIIWAENMIDINIMKKL